MTGRLDQPALRQLFADRIRRCRPDLAAGLDLDDPAGMLSIARTAAVSPDAALTTVIRRLVLPDWIRETCRAVAAIAPPAAHQWRATFTRTVFLSGNPANLAHRFAFDHLAASHDAAWLAPGHERTAEGLSRLLKLVSAPAAPVGQPPVTVEIPGGRSRSVRLLYLVTARVTLTDTLVHLNHLLAEAVLDGLIGPGTRLALRPVPFLTGAAVPPAAVRVAPDPVNPGSLRAYAALTEETADA